jgi:hypothetical protein
MTEQRKLKQTVRTRMARTGESYTAARRQVVRRTPAPGSPAVRHRDSALVRHQLAAAGLPLSEAMVCGLGGGIGFLYAVFTYRDVPHPLLTIVAQHHPQPWANAVYTKLGVDFTEEHSTSPGPALTKLRRALDDGPVLCTVDRSGLPWHTGVSPLAAADPHPVLVLWATADEVSVLDADETPRAVALPVFATAWAGHKRGRHHQLRITAVPSTVDLAGAARDAVATTTAHLTGPVLGNAFDVNLGFSGMNRLVSDLRATRGRPAWITRFADHLEYVLPRLVECVRREYTADDATRTLFADFLAEAAPLLDLPALPLAIDAMRASGQSWASAARVAASGGESARSIFDGIATHVQACLDYERGAVEALTPVA